MFKIWYQLIWYLVRAHFLVHNWPSFFAVSSHRGRATRISAVSFIRALMPFMTAPPS